MDVDLQSPLKAILIQNFCWTCFSAPALHSYEQQQPIVMYMMQLTSCRLAFPSVDVGVHAVRAIARLWQQLRLPTQRCLPV